MPLKQIVLKLYISLNFGDIPLSIRLCLLVILINLFFEVILNPLLQSLDISDALFSDPFKLQVLVMKPFALSHELVLILTVCVAELHEL